MSGSSYTAEEVKAEVRQTIRHLSEMTRTESSFDQFCQEVLSRVVQLTGAHGALLWQLNPGGKPAVTHKAAGRTAQQLSPNAQHHSDLVNEVVAKEKALSIPSSSLPSDGEAQEAAYLMLFAPIFDRSKNCCGSIELLQRNEITDSAKEGYLRFLGQIAQLFPRWHEHQDLERLTVDEGVWNKKLDYITEIHKSLDWKETSYAIANEARRLLKCDRASVAKWNGSSCKITAISSQDRFDNRANVVRKLGYVATSSVSADTSFWIIGDTDGIAPEVASQINDYLDESHCRTLAVLPLVRRPPDTPDLEMDKRKRERPEKLGALIIEYFDADVKEDAVHDMTQIAVAQATQALDNAKQHTEIFLMPFWRWLGRVWQFLFRDHYSKAMTGLGVLAFLFLLMAFYPANLKMKVDGVMQPEVRRNLFAQTDGIIKDVLVDENELVKVGDQLVVMDNVDLRMEISDTEGALRTIKSQIASMESRLSMDVLGEGDDATVLGGELDALNSQQKIYEDKLVQLETKKEKLVVAAPIDGMVTTWQPKQRLDKLPRTTNQLIMSLADPDSQWQLEIKIPENKIGYISSALTESETKTLPVEFILGTDASSRCEGTLIKVANRAEMSDAGVPEFRGIVNIDMSNENVSLEALRPGAGVTAKVICGRESLGFVWFHQIIDFVRTQVLFF